MFELSAQPDDDDGDDIMSVLVETALEQYSWFWVPVSGPGIY